MNGNMCDIKYLVLNDDIVEILYNKNLSQKPYLVRFTSFNDQYEFRANNEDLLEIADTILSVLEQEKKFSSEPLDSAD